MTRASAFMLFCALLLACASDTHTAVPTYWQDVAPLFAEHRWQCHREGGIGPIHLDDYAEVKQFAP